MTVVARVGDDVVTVTEVDDRERALRAGGSADALPRAGTSEARQLRRWITQVLVAQKVVDAHAGTLGGHDRPSAGEQDVLPDAVARMEIGSVAASTLDTAPGRAVFAAVTAAVRVSDHQVAEYHARNPGRFAKSTVTQSGWTMPAATDFDAAKPAIAAHLLAAARRREYRRWLDARCVELVTLEEGYEHPGDPRQPDNTHRH